MNRWLELFKLIDSKTMGDWKIIYVIDWYFLLIGDLFKLIDSKNMCDWKIIYFIDRYSPSLNFATNKQP